MEPLPSTAFRIFVPGLMLGIFETAFFWARMVPDGRQYAEETLSEANRVVFRGIRDLALEDPKRAAAAWAYVRGVHANSESLRESSEREKARSRSRSATAAALILALSSSFVLISYALLRTKKIRIPWRKVLVQSLTSVVIIAAFQVGFYFQVAKRYEYATPEEIVADLSFPSP